MISYVYMIVVHIVYVLISLDVYMRNVSMYLSIIYIYNMGVSWNGGT